MLANGEAQPKTRYERHMVHKFLEAERLTALSEASRELFLRLCVLRRGLSRDANIPAYQVLSNSVLLALCEQRPQDLFGLIAIPGFGQVRLRAYGAEVLAVLRGSLSGERKDAGNAGAGVGQSWVGGAATSTGSGEEAAGVNHDGA